MGSVKISGFSFRHGRRRISFPCLWRAVIGMATSAAMGMKTVRAEVPKKNGPPWWFSPICVEGVYNFILLGKLAGKHEYVCNVHLSKMSPFWLK